MTSPEQFSGERFLPGVIGEIAYEHWHRYAFARRYVRGRRVLDAACGEGYGSALLAGAAASVIGIDIDREVVARATARYGKPSKLAFQAASITRLPLDDASIDVVVSFETIEHLSADDQRLMLAEFTRVLAPEGLLVISSPNRPEYSDARGYANPYHLKELDRDELASLLRPTFAAQRWFRQRRYFGSAIWGETAGDGFEALSGSTADVAEAALPAAMYFIVVAARSPDALPTKGPALSVYADRDDLELARIDHEAREVLRLDALARERDEQLRLYIAELQAVSADREKVMEERVRADGVWRAALDEANLKLDNVTRAAADEHERLSRQLQAQERLIAYRESVRWWFVLPWVRIRRLWNRIRAA